MIFPLTPHPAPNGTLSQSDPRQVQVLPRGDGTGRGGCARRCRLAADGTCELLGFVHMGNGFLNGLKGTKFQVMADM